MSGDVLLRARGLRTAFAGRAGETTIVNGVGFDLRVGEVLGLIGESGSGKTVTGLSLLQLLPANARISAGELSYRGRDMMSLSPTDLRALRGVELSMIFQDPVGSFNPAKTIDWHLRQAIRRSAKDGGAGKTAEPFEILKRVGIRDPNRTLSSYPHQLSGGMLQRTLIAMVFAMHPRLVVADEPTTNLDNIVERQIVELIRHYQREQGTAVLFITHDLTLARHICDRIAVMYAGQIVEIGSVEQVLTAPSHPYTRGLLETAQSLARGDEVLFEISGELGQASWNNRCAFLGRCPSATEPCRVREPVEVEVGPGHHVRCFNHDR